ncbi:hypothetical protein CN425_05120 [Bacillus cereus]|uniref:Uncharacterized protein n=1 Tax=Bacillus cereus TaxID=1396 RepID=A0A2A8Q057_BACCE|nr:hypothetical protein [Bacillus cereus]PEW04515.1 hypothetical protein CN425_05120 [Bacillus cereus]
MKGKYFAIKESNYMYYVTSVNTNTINLNETLSVFIPNSVVDFPVELSIEDFQNLIDSQKIVEIPPPTIFIVTNKETYKIRKELTKAGARWVTSMGTKGLWVFKNKPLDNSFKVKEVLLYPFTGKRL